MSTQEARGAEDRRSATVDAVEARASRFLSDRQAAEMLGVGERTFADLMRSANWLPQPIVLGPRLRRWDADELLHAARHQAPRGAKVAEPAQLRRARIEKLKATGSAT